MQPRVQVTPNTSLDLIFVIMQRSSYDGIFWLGRSHPRPLRREAPGLIFVIMRRPPKTYPGMSWVGRSFINKLP